MSDQDIMFSRLTYTNTIREFAVIPRVNGLLHSTILSKLAKNTNETRTDYGLELFQSSILVLSMIGKFQFNFN
jgi:hypothetical protein